MSQIFGCPYCQNSFGVPDDAAGQTFECPSCDRSVKVPDPNAAEPEVYRCPHCEGDFAIDSKMYGQQLACPHCENHVTIGDQSSPTPRVEEDVFDIKIKDDSIVVPPIVVSSPPPMRSSKKKSSAKNDAFEKASSGTEKGQEPAESSKTRRKGKPQQPATSQSGLRSVARLLPPTFDVPDPIRFPHKIGANEILLPDGRGGYQTAEANVVTITHQGKVYHLQRLSPEERRKRQLIHNTIAISIAVLLIFLTLRTIGFFS